MTLPIVFLLIAGAALAHAQTPARLYPDGHVGPAPTSAASAPSPAAAAVAPAIVEPSQFFSAGAGIQGVGPAQIFGYYSLSQLIAEGTYTTEITELSRMTGGKVGTCVRAGVSKTLWRFSVINIGIVGDAGGCEGVNGSLSGAMAARSFVTARIGKSGWHFVGTAENLKIAGEGNQTVISLGIGYGIFK